MRTYLILLLPAMLTACVQPGGKISLANSNTHVVKEMYEAFNEHNWEKMAACYHDTAVFLDPSLGPAEVLHTRQQIADKYRELGKMFPDVHDEVKEMYGDKNHIIVEFVSSGTGPDGKKWSLPICTVFTVENGKITRDHTYYDEEK
ncbi:nuclear transport factor 2 family protein [Chitinophaga sp. Mgbs1]|uniref:Nuclear transport factor 2 family protein n=1 Tax=Chitinophaga solisilvae TaxID=1233460 RepID=A0A3S1JJZ9_9BACT|nr:nuclear transport factor 2 family protein [Chitinophaga solisilvae]